MSLDEHINPVPLQVGLSLWALDLRHGWASSSDEHALLDAVTHDLRDAAYDGMAPAPPPTAPYNPTAIPPDIRALSHAITADARSAALDISQAPDLIDQADAALEHAQLRADLIAAEPEAHPIHSLITSIVHYTCLQAGLAIERHCEAGEPTRAAEIKALLESSTPHIEQVQFALELSAETQVDMAQVGIQQAEIIAANQIEAASHRIGPAMLQAAQSTFDLIDSGELPDRLRALEEQE